MDSYIQNLNIDSLTKSNYEYIIPIKQMYYIQNRKVLMSSKELLISIGNSFVNFAIEGKDEVGEHIYKATISKDFLINGLKYFPFYKKYKNAHSIDYCAILIGNKIYGRYYECNTYTLDYEPEVLRKNSITNHNFAFLLDMIAFIGFDDHGKFVSLAFDKDNFTNKEIMKFAILTSANGIRLFRGNFISPFCLELIDIFDDKHSISIIFSEDSNSIKFVDNVISQTNTFYSYYLIRED